MDVESVILSRVGFLPQGKNYGYRNACLTILRTIHLLLCIIFASISLCEYVSLVDPTSWLYACRGLYQCKDYALCLEALSHCANFPATQREAVHLRAFCLLHLQQNREALLAFRESVRYGNDDDWQPLVELVVSNTNKDVVEQ